MKPIVKKSVSVLLAVLFAIGIIPVSKPLQASAISLTTSEVTAKLNSIKSIYYPNKYWNGNKTEAQLISAVDNGKTDNSSLGLTTTGCPGSNRDSGCTSNTFCGDGRQCFGFAFYMDYVLFKARPNKNGGAGYTVYTGNNCPALQPGDHLISPNESHSAIVWKIENGKIYVVDVWGSKSDRHAGCLINYGSFYYNGTAYTTPDGLLNLIKSGGKILRPTSYISSTPSTPPTSAPTVSISNTMLAVNEYAELTWTETPLTSYYWVYCYSDSLGTVISADGGSEFLYHVYFSTPGTYYITVSACNNYGSQTGNTIVITVYDSKPQSSPTVSLSNTMLAVNEAAVLTWTAVPLTSYYWIYCYNDDGSVISKDGGTDFSESISFSEAGTYYIQVSACNNYGFSAGNKIVITVYDSKPQSSPTVSLSKTNLAVNESAVLTWTAVPLTSYYWIYCYNDYGSVISKDGGTDFSESISFSQAGTYYIQVSACNNYGYAAGNKIVINVVETCTLTFNANGGTCTPSSKTVTINSPYGDLPTPTRNGYTFDGWYNYIYNGGTFENGTVNGDYVALGRDCMFTDKIAIHVEAYQSDWSAFDSQLISCTEGGGWGMGYFANSNGNGPGADVFFEGVGYKHVVFDYRTLSSGWHAFDLVFDGGNLIGYVDGVEKGRVATGGTTIRYNAANGIFIGAEAGLDEVTPISNYFTGTIGCVIISHSDTMCGAITSDSIVSITDNHTLYAKWIANTPVVNPATGSGAVLDESTHFIYGLSVGAAQGCVAVTDGTAAYEYPTARQALGTGTNVNVYNNDNELVDSYTVVVFGDVDGDGWYDGTDAYYVSLLANGLIPQAALTAAQRTACDANHDGVIDAADVALIEKAGLLLNQIDQNLTQEELQLDSVYLAYCGLIDQSVEITEPDQPTAVDEPQPAAQSVFGWLKALFAAVLNWLLRAF